METSSASRGFTFLACANRLITMRTSAEGQLGQFVWVAPRKKRIV